MIVYIASPNYYDAPLIEKYLADYEINILLSIDHVWRKTKGLKDFIIPNNTKRLFIDSGAYGLVNRYKDYPFSLNEYAEMCEKISSSFSTNEKYFSTLDVPCHTKYFTPKEAIEKTVENTKELSRLNLKNLVPCVQGFLLRDFQRCITLMKNEGLLTKYKYIGIGSVCYRQPKSALSICQFLLNKLEDLKLHAFGLTIGIWSKLWNKLYSVDTGTYAAYLRHGRVVDYDKETRKFKSHFIYHQIPTKQVIIRNIKAILDLAKDYNENPLPFHPKLTSFFEHDQTLVPYIQKEVET